ncbi:RagB/SusD family nutrient uptake outer membrane protein [Runella slithyformis]|uniref:RagB/SusD domain-containing protein n=1 Tax=Runella slithyformis (strain ATCC 29530 / DSM 19594 / LMG 11500 / NCIMB 11436 / LSU 4) TaxID=761193 RepID=A0A7U3ZLL2_RUNSL|nr:RagB/SusD family nutrient uptake outer membrane protein [Runella slithyformis]AEI49465.1 RagB/SusD domain-containing protein [Runella slithyformis DSM 19594]
MNRLFKYSFLTAAALTLLSGCDEKLNVAPTQSIDDVAALSTSKDVEVTLIGCYDGIQDGDVYGGAFQYVSDLYGDAGEIRFGGTFANLLEIFDKQLTTANSTASATWIDSYNAINRCNNVLSALSKVDESKKARIEGEARFIRGSLYFELVRLYAKTWGDGDNAANPGVPLVLVPTRSVTDADYRKRNSVAEVYAQVLDDLTKAESLLPATNTIYATKNAAAGMLARVYLQQGNNASARDAANRVITSGRQRLVTPFSSLFYTSLRNGGASPAEYIFSTVVTAQDGANSLNTFFGVTVGSIPGTAGRGDFRILPAHRALYGAGDTRGEFFQAANNQIYTQKHLDRFGNVPIMRLAEMFLIRAETNLRLGTTVGADPLVDINTIRARAGATALTAVTIADILRERKLELAFEGHTLHDIKRLKGKVGALDFNSPRLIFPIPQREMDANKQLTQNAGY